MNSEDGQAYRQGEKRKRGQKVGRKERRAKTKTGRGGRKKEG
jgi:hypothetical protein